ncbi:hypothetical protein Tco_1305178, partial [Tanacetum coccineum]
MHNNIMAAGSRDRLPMLATGLLHNGDHGSYDTLIQDQMNSSAVPEQTTVETVMNMTSENRAHFESEKEAIHLILTGI